MDEKNFNQSFEPVMTENQANLLSVLTLAFLGDSVHTLYVRTELVKKNTGKTGTLHKATSNFVNAEHQARTFEKIFPLLTEAEKGIILRARNAKNTQSAKHASVTDYRKATGFEALLGFLYLTGQTKRLDEILKISME